MEVVRSQFTELLKADMYAYAFEAYDPLPKVHEQIFQVKGSNSAYEQGTTAIKGNTFVEKPETEEIVFHNPLEGYTVYSKNRTFSDGVQFTMEMVEDTPPEKIRNIVLEYASAWGEELARKKEMFAADFFNYGGYTAGHDIFNSSITGVTPSGAPTALCYDGKPFFNLVGNKRALYPGGSASYYNSLTPAGFNAPALITAYQLMTNTNNVDGNGRKIVIKPNTLLVPAALTFDAMNVLQANGVIGSANNDINKAKNLVNAVEWQYLTSSSAWFVGVAGKGLVFHNRKPLTLDFWQDQTTKSYYATAIARFGSYVQDFRYWVGNDLATS